MTLILLQRSFIATLAILDSLKAKGVIDFSIIPEKHALAWKHQKEATTVEPSTFSHRHYKCDIFDPILNKFDSVMQSAPLEFGFALTS